MKLYQKGTTVHGGKKSERIDDVEGQGHFRNLVHHTDEGQTARRQIFQQ